MGVKATEALDLTLDELPSYLRARHSVYMDVDDAKYYITDVNEKYWRAQDTTQFNDKGHYIDVSELVPTVSEFLGLPFAGGQTLGQVFDRATFYASENPE